MSQVEGWITVLHLNAALRQCGAGVIILFLSIAPLRIEHDAHLDPARMGLDHLSQERCVLEDKYLDRKCSLGLRNSVNDQRVGIFWKNDDRVRHLESSRMHRIAEVRIICIAMAAMVRDQRPVGH